MRPTPSQDVDAVAGVIMAGGDSRRFGRDKARHAVDGMPMIRRVHRALTAVARPIVVSVGTAETSYADVLPADVAHVPDRRADAGPLAGLDAGFRAVRSTWVLVAACDMPHVTPDGFRTLLHARSGSADAIVGRSDDGHRHPLFACYRHEPALQAIQHCLAENTYALHAWLDRLAIHEVTIPSRIVHNVNRPQDLDGS